jgi:hypothetical protein
MRTESYAAPPLRKKYSAANTKPAEHNILAAIISFVVIEKIYALAMPSAYARLI